MKTVIKNGTVITPTRVIENGELVIEEGKIQKVLEKNSDPDIEAAEQVIDAKGCYISPGFIDIHTHGGFGYNYLDGTIEAIIKPAVSHMAHGTTSLVPTISTAPFENMIKALDCFTKAKREITEGPNLLGVHVEGPYFSMEMKGAQDPRLIRKPDRKSVG